MKPRLKGWRTVLFNAVTGGVVVGLTYAAHVPWIQYVDPIHAIVIITLVNIVLRLMTSTPVGRPE